MSSRNGLQIVHRTHALEQLVSWAATHLAVVLIGSLVVLSCFWLGGVSIITTLLCVITSSILAAFVATRLLSIGAPLCSKFEAQQAASGVGFPVQTATMLLQVLFIGRPGLPPLGAALPELSVTLTDVTVSEEEVRAYSHACQLEQGDAADAALPLLFLESFARPLSLFIATHPLMPLNLLGSVHARSTVISHGIIRAGQCVDVRCRVEPVTRPHRRGVEMDLITEYFMPRSRDGAGFKVMYTTTMTIICFGKKTHQTSVDTATAPRPQFYSESFHRGATVKRRTLAFAANAGRVFARVTGDYNPIHVSSMAARAFGQRGTIVHGMCVCGSMAQLGVQRLSSLQESQNSCYQFEVAFKGPVIIPSSVEVRTLQSLLEGEDEEIDGTTVYLEAQELANAKINIVARLHLH